MKEFNQGIITVIRNELEKTKPTKAALQACFNIMMQLSLGDGDLESMRDSLVTELDKLSSSDQCDSRDSEREDTDSGTKLLDNSDSK
jgi:hypothetical protein